MPITHDQTPALVGSLHRKYSSGLCSRVPHFASRLHADRSRRRYATVPFDSHNRRDGTQRGTWPRPNQAVLVFDGHRLLNVAPKSAWVDDVRSCPAPASSRPVRWRHHSLSPCGSNHGRGCCASASRARTAQTILQHTEFPDAFSLVGLSLCLHHFS